MERVSLTVNGTAVTVRADHPHLLAALREELNITSPKDGCSPSGQCGCCTVMVDGRIVGLWWSHNKGSRIVVRFFERVDPEAMALAAEEARALGVFLEGHEVDIDVGLFEEDLEGEASPLPLRAPSGR